MSRSVLDPPLRKSCLTQGFLTWVRSNPRGSGSQSQGFGGGQDTHSINMIRDDTLRLAIIGCREFGALSSRLVISFLIF